MMKEWLFKRRNSWIFRISGRHHCAADYLPTLILLAGFLAAPLTDYVAAYAAAGAVLGILIFVLTENFKKHTASAFLQDSVRYMTLFAIISFFYAVFIK